MMEERTIKKILTMGMMVVIIIGGGLFALNQTMIYYYNSELLQAPCNLCLELNPEINPSCFTKKEFIIAGEFDRINFTIPLP